MDRKKLLLIVGVVASVFIGLLLVYFLFFRDGGDDPSNPDPDQQIVLEYWGLWEPEAVMEPLIAGYEEANPHVRIVYTQRSFNQYEDTIFTRLEQGASTDTPAPDIFRINNTWLNKFQQYLAPLPETVMDSSTYVDSYYPTAVSDFSGTDGNIYAIPLEVDGLALYYNKEIFDKAGLRQPPSSWNEVRDVAIQLTEKDDSGNIEQAGLGAGVASNVMHSADVFSLLLLQNGVEINQNFNTEVNITDQRSIDALVYYTQFFTQHGVWDEDQRSDLEMFFSGKLAMMFGPSWRAFDIIEANPTIEFGIVPTPNIIEGQETYFSMYWGEAVSGTSQNQTEAWKFVEYLSQQEQQREFFNSSIEVTGRAFGEPYGRKDLGPELSDNFYVAPFIQMAPNMKAWKMGDQSYIEEQFRIAIEDVAVNGADPEEALRKAQENINERLSDTIR